ncbi:hypothetical protein [Collinsella tanakaei]|uniref:hypothetical protein n=1 Tax=Collinsella tanakaei TaxID=626935 RepID=UPI001F38161C|nr:hypothetical protein [Collinsella tanakaei]MCF2621889.1 hypothetical protein [Collinsella tanakaei]MDM8302316.1 hypothetical protein [Collinsella tanakaei]
MSFLSSLFGKKGVTRRSFVAGSAAAAAATAAAVSVAGCSDESSVQPTTGEPQFIDDESQIIDALEEYKAVDETFEASNSWTLPLGTLLFHSDGVWAAAMMAPESASSVNTIGVLSLTSGDLVTLESVPTKGTSFDFFDVRCGSGVFAWVEIDYATLDWTLLAAGFADGQLTSDPVELDQGDADWDPSMFTTVGSTVYWLKMPSASGSHTSDASHCYRWSVGDAEHQEVYESPGRFATHPRVCAGVLTIAPRVHADEGTYYGLTALDVSDANLKRIDQLVLPAGVRPFEAVYMGESFAFAIEASYTGSGSLGNMGTFIGREGGPYVYVSREPAACPAGMGSRYAIKARSSHFVIDTAEQTYTTLSCPDRSLDYGDYPASEGACDMFVTYATVKDRQGIPTHVTARVFTL